jgi:hypothetical protein
MGGCFGMPLNHNNLNGLQGASGVLAGALQTDSAWTSLVVGPDRSEVLSEEAVDEILARYRALRSAIDGAVSAGEQIVNISALVVRDDPAFEGPSPSLVAALEPSGNRDALDALSEADNSVVRLAEQGVAEMQEGHGEAIAVLMTDLQGVLCRGAVKGYLPDRFLCGLAKASLAAGLITVWVPPHAHAAAAVALGATVYKTAGCRGRAPAMPR